MSKKKITMLDGAMGTTLWEHTTNRDPVWKYNIENPEVVKQVVKEFADAGAEIITSNSFAANRPNVEANSNYSVEEVVSAAIRLEKEALAGTDKKVALDLGPLSAILEPFGDLSVDDCRKYYEEMISAGMQEHPDLIYLMTFMDLEMMKIAVSVAKQYQVPVFASMTFGEFGATLMGNTVDDIVAALEPMGVDALGMNCSLGPDKAFGIVKQYREKTSLPVLFKPNAGVPILSSDGKEEKKPYSPEEFANDLVPAFEYADMVGGCCGTNATYLTAVRKAVEKWEADDE
jgi:5-methyltetrahydrofolate--homocysteine methyltransferase